MLKQKLKDDLKRAMLSRAEVTTSTLRLLLSKLSYYEMTKGKEYEASDEEVLDTIQKSIKEHTESIEQFAKGGRPDLVAKETSELGILKSYLPPLSPFLPNN